MYDPPLGALLACIRSVTAQAYPHWEWCLVDDCSTRPEVGAALDAAAAADPRIRVQRRATNGGIVAATNDALAMATGEFVALLDHDDTIVPDALATVMGALDGAGGSDVDYLYTDEAHVLADGREAAHFLKPDWSPERFRSSMYTCHLSVLRRGVVQAIGGFREGFDGSQDHDLILRATEHITANGRRIVHLPVLAYHWRNISSSVSRDSGTQSVAVERGRRAVQEQCTRLGLDAEVVHGPVAGTYRLVRAAGARATVTVVVPSRLEGAASRPYRLAVAATVRAIAAQGERCRLVVAHPDSTPAPLVELLDDELLGPHGAVHWQRVTVPGPWSLAAAIDRVHGLHPSDVIVSLAPGMVPHTASTPDWVSTLAGLALSPGAGAVGGLVTSDDGVVLHAGWDEPDYRWYDLVGLRAGGTTSGNDLLIERECTAVSLVATAVSAAQWRECRHLVHGGFDDAGRSMSAALAARGARTLFTPYARFDRTVTIDG